MLPLRIDRCCMIGNRFRASRVGGLQHRYTRIGGARPYGVACLVAGFDEDTLLPSVFRSEPSGAFAEWTASAVGKGSDKVRARAGRMRVI